MASWLTAQTHRLLKTLLDAVENTERESRSFKKRDHGESSRMQIFLSYAKEDAAKATRLFEYLSTKDLAVWMDMHSLTGGQQWMNVIEEEIRKSTIFLALLSATSVHKTGIVQREFKIALSHQENKPRDRTFIIPILLEDCNLPAELSHLQYVDLTNSDGYEAAYQSIQRAFDIERRFRGVGFSFNSLNYPLYAATIESPAMNHAKKDFVFQAPFPGVFYRGTSPKAGPYRREGEKFKKGDPLFIIECFKMFHEFSAEEDGIVGAFLAENGTMLKEGSPVFLFYYEKNRKNRVL